MVNQIAARGRQSPLAASPHWPRSRGPRCGTALSKLERRDKRRRNNERGAAVARPALPRFAEVESFLVCGAGTSTTMLGLCLIVSLTGYVIVGSLACVWISRLRRLGVRRSAGCRAGLRSAHAVIGCSGICHLCYGSARNKHETECGSAYDNLSHLKASVDPPLTLEESAVKVFGEN
jgi:hypothetical protein